MNKLHQFMKIGKLRNHIFVFFCVCSVGLYGQKIPKNVIIIYTDDLGYGDVACYGNSEIPTPKYR